MQGRVLFLVARLIPSVLGLVVAAVLTHVLTPDEYGRYALGLSIVFFLSIGVFEWLGLSLMRMTAGAGRPDRLFGTIMTCMTALFAACVAVAGVTLAAGGVGHYASLIVASLAASFATVWFELRQRLQMAELRALEYFRMSVGRGLLTTLLVCVTALASRSAALSLSALAVGVLLAGLLAPERQLRFRKLSFDPEILRALLTFGVPLSISVGLTTVLMSIDKWLLLALSGPQAVGSFTAATLVVQIPILALANGIGPLGYSMAVRTHELQSEEATSVNLAQNFIILLAIVLPSAAGVVALSDNLARQIVGPFYWQTVVSLAPWLSAGAVVATIRAFYIDTAFQLAHRTAPLLVITLFAVLANVALDLWLIPPMGLLGAAIGSFVALLASSVVGAIASRFVFPLPLPLADTAKVAASASVMYLIVHRLAAWTGPWALLCQIAAGGLVYSALVILLNVLTIRTSLARRLPTLRQPPLEQKP